jgi:hypothetical protein
VPAAFSPLRLQYRGLVHVPYLMYNGEHMFSYSRYADCLWNVSRFSIVLWLKGVAMVRQRDEIEHVDQGRDKAVQRP